MSRAIQQAAVPSDKRLMINKNNQHVMPPLVANKPYIKPPTKKQILSFIKTLGYDEDTKTKMTSVATFVTTRLHQLWRAILSVVTEVLLDEFEWQDVDRASKPSKMSKLIYTRFTKLIIDNFLSCNKSIPRRSDAKLQSEGKDSEATQDSLGLDVGDEKDDETDDSKDFDMDLSEDEPKRDDDATRFGVFMYNKSTRPLPTTSQSPTVTCSSLDFINTLLIDPLVNELIDLMSNRVYNDAHTTSMVANPEVNLEVTSFVSGASEWPVGIHVDVQATNFVLQEMFSNNAVNHTSSLLTTTSKLQLNSLQSKAKKLMPKAKNKMRKINFKKK
ncbi:hypothetical protein Tco_1129485 [Tanacetum coccineum]